MSNKVLKSGVTLDVRDSNGWLLHRVGMELVELDNGCGLTIINDEDGNRVSIPEEVWGQLVDSGNMLLSQVTGDDVEVKPEYEIYRDK